MKALIKKLIINNFWSKTLRGAFSYSAPVELDTDTNILVVAPHCDDELIGCGQLLKKLRNVSVLIFTEQKDSDVNSIRYEESLALSKQFDYNLVSVRGFFDGDAFSLSLTRKMNFDFLKNFNAVFLPSPFERHPDHVYTTKMFLNSRELLGKEVYFYEVWSTLPWITHYIASDDSKAQYMSIFKSQMQTYPYKEMIMSREKYRAFGLNRKFGEAYLKYENGKGPYNGITNT